MHSVTLQKRLSTFKAVVEERVEEHIEERVEEEITNFLTLLEHLLLRRRTPKAVCSPRSTTTPWLSY